PFLEQPWARSGTGQAGDGLSKYDLTRFNPSYFNRLEEFAEICKAKGTILFHNFYMQHALLETNAHYVDFPWREANCIQNTSMPDTLPAANFFYDTSDSTRRTLHRTYIRRCLDALGEKTNVIHCLSEEYTGPASFMRFWLDEVTAWEREKGVQVHLALGAPKDVIDEILADSLYRARISTIDLRYWWYEADGSLYAPLGGKEIAGRYSCGFEASKTTPWQIYRQVRSYRDLYPEKAIIHNFEASRQQTWAFLTAGGSMLIRRMEYPEASDPPEYIAPEHAFIIKPTYDFINKFLAQNLPRMTPQDLVLDKPRSNWVLAEQDRNYLVYASQGGSFRLDLRGLKSPFEAWWFNPRTGDLLPVEKGSLAGGKISGFTAPDTADWALWLTRIKP
ncbi:MAG: DUF6298 domain-containing protein, partial [Gemmatimonadota bacterium]|nr:DUF6298 domain-containing protein [Gemmatimonadota bacterium]